MAAQPVFSGLYCDIHHDQIYRGIMNEQDIRNALEKQLQSAYAIQTRHGDIELDEDLKAVLEKAMKPVLEKKLAMLEAQNLFK